VEVVGENDKEIDMNYLKSFISGFAGAILVLLFGFGGWGSGGLSTATVAEMIADSISATTTKFYANQVWSGGNTASNYEMNIQDAGPAEISFYNGSTAYSVGVGSSGGGNRFALQTGTLPGSINQVRMQMLPGGETTFGGTAIGNVQLFLKNNANLAFLERTTEPPALTQDTEAQIYVKADKFIIKFDNGGTTKYWYMDLTSTAATWTYTTVAP